MGNSGARQSGKNKPQFLDLYDVDEQLGEGSFGVVYACSPKGSSKECAVKMVDKVETPVAKIMAEAEMLSRMKHPNVICCHDVFHEKCFVCIVMDRLRGGDLICGMQAHWKEKGRIAFNVTGLITYQMIASVDYLHGRSIIHRDVKADNFLCDRPDITDEKLRVVLTDFGTAMDISPGQRLTEKAGTKLYWSPEFYALHYSLPVDIWAVGVVVYGLLLGRFPFKNEADVKKKALKIDASVPEDYSKLVSQMLEKEENKRIKAASLVQIQWLKKMKRDDLDEGRRNSQDRSKHPDETDDFREVGAKIGVKERREELVERMVESAVNLQDKAAATRRLSSDKNRLHFYADFNIRDKFRKTVLLYEWWQPDKVEATIDIDSKEEDNAKSSQEKQQDKGVAEVQAGSPEMITEMLASHNINVDRFGEGEAKTLQQLAHEIQGGAATLMLDAADYKKLVRVVDVVLLRIHPLNSDDQFLIETKEIFPDGRKRTTNRLPGTKKEPHENSRQTAQRIMKDMIDFKDAQVTFDYYKTDTFEVEEMSPSYPGVCTVYRKEIIHGYVTQNQSSGSSLSWKKMDSNGNTKEFEWLGEEECVHRGVEYKRPTDDHAASALVPVPVGFDEEDLEEYLKQNQVEITKFGQDAAKSLEEFAAELQKGEAFLMRDPDGSVIRVVDVVLLSLTNEATGKVLIQAKQRKPDGASNTLNRLPGMKGRPDQNHFITAKKILSRHLHIPENYVNFSTEVKLVEQEQQSLHYPGVRTIYRKQIIKATLQSFEKEMEERESLQQRLSLTSEGQGGLVGLLCACCCKKRERSEPRNAAVREIQRPSECELQNFNAPGARV